MEDEQALPKVDQILHPVGDVSAAVTFYGTAFGFSVAFQDGERFAAVEAGPVRLALAGAEEDVAGGKVAAAVKVADVTAAVDAAVAAGATVLRAPETGPHEVRAVVRDPWGNALVVHGRS